MDTALRTVPARKGSRNAPCSRTHHGGKEPQAEPSDLELPALGKMTGPGPQSCESQLVAEVRCPVLAPPSDGSLALSGADQPLALPLTFMFWTGFNKFIVDISYKFWAACLISGVT